ncbi:AraC family transcriptional regulator [Paenibacillus sp. BK720]|uniref:AraC family transcriptional regulator n=1 Tax=Paenibacillus sp. BK720 TaxID=2587092 RepID=UPI0014234AFF|nr:AraC family transcriptional regulator [Paenibacillus sp. BK720]NIK67393.1 AraC family transcriptional regulator of arabinose operon [Paenibacillus sp. BK720]
MLSLISVHYDNRIPNWRNGMARLTCNILALITEGKIRYTVNQKSYIAVKGDLLFIPAGSWRASENYEGEHAKLTLLFNYGEEEAGEIELLARSEFRIGKLRSFEYIRHRFERLYREWTVEGKNRRMVSTGIVQEIIGIATREMESSDIAPNKLKLAGKLQQFMVEHYRDAIPIDQLAGLIQRSPNYTISLFREVMGLSPIQYMHQLRMKEACRLLGGSDLTVSEIATFLGYYDHSYFYRMFKKHTSLSPSAYRLNGSAEAALTKPHARHY